MRRSLKGSLPLRQLRAEPAQAANTAASPEGADLCEDHALIYVAADALFPLTLHISYLNKAVNDMSLSIPERQLFQLLAPVAFAFEVAPVIVSRLADFCDSSNPQMSSRRRSQRALLSQSGSAMAQLKTELAGAGCATLQLMMGASSIIESSQERSTSALLQATLPEAKVTRAVDSILDSLLRHNWHGE